MFQGLVLWFTVGALLNAVGYAADTWQFWCFIATYWAMNTFGRHHGRIEGMIDYLEMTEQEQQMIKQTLDKVKEEMK